MDCQTCCTLESELESERKRRIRAEAALAKAESKLESERAMWRYVDKRDETKTSLQHALELIDEILDDPNKLHHNIKMTPQQFDEMYDEFNKYADKCGRVPQCSDTEFGQGKVCMVTLRHILFLALAYMTTGLTQDRLGSHFSISQPTISRYVAYVQKFLPIFFASTGGFSKAIKNCKTIKELKEWIPNLELFGDCTESFINVPTDEELNEDYYSGYKHHHTVKEGVLTNNRKEILDITKTYPGPKSDIVILREMELDWGKWGLAMKDPNTPDKEKFDLYLDAVYISAGEDYLGVNVITPYKRPPKGQLTKEQMEFNRWQRAIRVIIENVIGEGKQYAILQHQFQGNDDDHNLLMQGIATLVNYNRLWDKIRDRPTARLKKLKEIAGIK